MAIETPCCLELERADCCDRLDFTYTLPHRATVSSPIAGVAPSVIPVDVIIHVRIERCPGAYVLGDLTYTTTLLPGEKVRLFSTDRRSRFSFDAETKLSYRHVQASEDQFYMSNFAREMSDLNVTESASSASHAWGDWGADMDSQYGTIAFAGAAGGSINGHYDDQSTRDFLSGLKSHAESSHYRSELATRTTSSISVGEINSRTHAQGESEDHFESASRVFSNPNRCHAVTFNFYRISRMQMIRVMLVSIDRKVKDPAAPTNIKARPPVPLTGVTVMPTSVLGSATNRLEVEARANQSAASKIAAAGGPATGQTGVGLAYLLAAQTLGTVLTAPPILEALTQSVRQQALEQVDEQLVKAGILAAVGGLVSPQASQNFLFEREFCLPTPGLMVKGCLDKCDICEPELKQEIELELQKKKLENDMLQKQIDLLEKSQEYRCCPEGEDEETE